MKDTTSNMFYYAWILLQGLLGVFHLRSIFRNAKVLKANEEQLLLCKEELKAKETKIIMLEAKIVYLESKVNTYGNTN